MATALSLFRAFHTDSTQTAFREKRPTSKRPSGWSVHDLVSEEIAIGAGIMDPVRIRVRPYGTGKPGDTFLLRFWSWAQVDGQELYIPDPVGEVKVTLGEDSGAAIGKDVYRAGKIEVKSGKIEVGGGNGLPAVLTLECVGTHWLDFDCARNGSPPAQAANAFWNALVQ